MAKKTHPIHSQLTTSAVLVIFLVCALTSTGQGISDLIPFKVCDKFGYSDKKLKIKIPPKFLFAVPFYDGRKTTIAKDSIGWFHINIKGEKISDYLTYTNIDEELYTPISETTWKANRFSCEYNDRFRVSKTNILYVKDTSGEYLITEDGKRVSNSYDEITSYTDIAYCVAKRDSSYYLLSRQGKELLPPTNVSPKFYAYDLAGIEYGPKTIIYDIHKDTTFSSIEDAIKYHESKPKIAKTLSDNLQIREAKTDGKLRYAIYDNKNKKYISDFFPNMRKLGKNRVSYSTKNTYGIIDYKGQKILQIEQSKDVEIFNCGELFRLIYIKRETPDKNGNRYDLYNYDGRHIKSVDYDNFIYWQSTKFYRFAKKGINLVIINSKGDEFHSASSILLNGDETILYQEDEKWGFKKITGENITGAFYDEEFSFQDGLALVKRGGDIFYIDSTGKEYKKNCQ
jgi:hypothetical protein